MAYPLSEAIHFLGERYQIAQQIEYQNENVPNVYVTGLPLQERYRNVLTAGNIVADKRIRLEIDNTDEIYDPLYGQRVNMTPFIVGLSVFCFLFPSVTHALIEDWVQVRDAAFYGLYEDPLTQQNFADALKPAVLMPRDELSFFFQDTPISSEDFRNRFFDYESMLDIGPGTTER
jgi:hypothetical protein